MFSACFEPLIDHPPWFPMIPKLLIDKPKTAHSNLKDLRFVLKKSCCLPPREKGDPSAPSLKAGAGWAWSWAWPRGPSARASSGSSSSPSTCHSNTGHHHHHHHLQWCHLHHVSSRDNCEELGARPKHL